MQVKGKIILGPSSQQPPPKKKSPHHHYHYPTRVGKLVIVRIITCPYWIKPIEMRWGECWGCSDAFSGSSTTCKHNLWKNKSINKKNVS